MLEILKFMRRKNATDCATVAFAINDLNFWNLRFGIYPDEKESGQVLLFGI